MRQHSGRWRWILAGLGALLLGAAAVLAAQPETIVLPDPPSASAPSTRRVVAGSSASASAPAATLAASAPASAASAPAAVKARRIPAPAGAALATAVKLVEEVYREDAQLSKAPGQRENLARRIRGDAGGEKDPAGRYAMLLKARDLAIEAGDVGTVDRVLGELDRGYEVDALKMASDALLPLIRNVHTPGQKKSLVDFTKEFAERALASENYDAARVMADKNAMAARMFGEVGPIKDAVNLLAAVTDAEAAAAASKKALETLATKPDDGDANLKVGTYRCFYRADWKQGLPRLAAGNDKNLADLAKKEMATGDPLALGDGWWEVGAKGTALTKKQVWKHAAEFYAAAMPTLSGLVKAKVNKRLEEAGLGESGLEIPSFVTAYLESISKQLPAKGESAADAAKKLSQVKNAGSALEVDKKDVPVTFFAKLRSVQIVDTRKGPQSQVFYELQFEFNGYPVRLTAHRTRYVPNPEDREHAAAAKALKDRPEAVYVIDGRAKGFGLSMTTIPGASDPCLIVNLLFVPASTFSVSEKD